MEGFGEGFADGVSELFRVDVVDVGAGRLHAGVKDGAGDFVRVDELAGAVGDGFRYLLA